MLELVNAIQSRDHQDHIEPHPLPEWFLQAARPLSFIEDNIRTCSAECGKEARQEGQDDGSQAKEESGLIPVEIEITIGGEIQKALVRLMAMEIQRWPQADGQRDPP